MKLERIYDKVSFALQEATIINNDFILLPRSFIEDYKKLLNVKVNVKQKSLNKNVKQKSLNKKYIMLL